MDNEKDELKKIIDTKSILICDCGLIDDGEWDNCRCYVRTTQGRKRAGPFLFSHIRGYRHGFMEKPSKLPKYFEIIPEEDRKEMEGIWIPQDTISEVTATRIPRYMQEKLDEIARKTGKEQSEILREAILLRIYRDMKKK